MDVGRGAAGASDSEEEEEEEDDDDLPPRRAAAANSIGSSSSNVFGPNVDDLWKKEPDSIKVRLRSAWKLLNRPTQAR